MTTIIINERSKDAKKMIEFLKTQRYATIIEEKEPTPALKKAIEESRKGKTTAHKSTADFSEHFQS
jgi:hypothetical protein